MPHIHGSCLLVCSFQCLDHFPRALLTHQVELPVRLGCCARVMELALAESGRKAHTALPRIVVAFVTAQLKVRERILGSAIKAFGGEPSIPRSTSAMRTGNSTLADDVIIVTHTDVAIPTG